jgi:hypothetical protein
MDLQCALARDIWANKILTRSDALYQQNRGLPAKAADNGSFKISELTFMGSTRFFPQEPSFLPCYLQSIKDKERADP